MLEYVSCTSYSFVIFHFDDVFLKTYSVRQNFFTKIFAIILWLFRFGTDIKLIDFNKFFGDRKLKELATKCWPLKRSSSFKVIVSIIGKNSSTRNFVSASMISSSVASLSRNLETFLVLFSTRETGSPNLRARIVVYFKIFLHWPLISLTEFSALPNSEDDFPRSISNACRSLDARLIPLRIFSQMINERRNSTVLIFFSRSSDLICLFAFTSFTILHASGCFSSLVYTVYS